MTYLVVCHHLPSHFRPLTGSWIDGHFSGVPTTQIKKYVVPEEGKKADLHLPLPIVEQTSEAHDNKIPMRSVNLTPG